jgi:hypothetical protein
VVSTVAPVLGKSSALNESISVHARLVESDWTTPGQTCMVGRNST